MNWQERLIRRYPHLFVQSFRGVPFAPGYPRCSDGWQAIVTRVAERVAKASKGSSVQFTQLLEQHGMLRVHWTSKSELPQRVELTIVVSAHNNGTLLFGVLCSRTMGRAQSAYPSFISLWPASRQCFSARAKIS
jgi:hypothetical protein